MDSADAGAGLRILQSYHFQGNYREGVYSAQRVWPRKSKMHSEVAYEFGKLLILEKDYALSALEFSGDLPISEVQRNFLRMHECLFLSNWDKAREYYEDWSEDSGSNPETVVEYS